MQGQPDRTRMGDYGTGGGDGDTYYADNAGYPGPNSGAAGKPDFGGGAAKYPMRPQTDDFGNPARPGATGGRNARGGIGQRIEGRVEEALGTVLGSQNLKARGAAKEQFVFFI